MAFISLFLLLPCSLLSHRKLQEVAVVYTNRDGTFITLNLRNSMFPSGASYRAFFMLYYTVIKGTFLSNTFQTSWHIYLTSVLFNILCVSMTKFLSLFFLQLDSLEYIHEKEYVHADIKSSNLLMGYAPSEQAKVIQ